MSSSHVHRMLGIVPAVEAVEPPAVEPQAVDTIKFLPPASYPVKGHAVLAQAFADDVNVDELAQKIVAALLSSGNTISASKNVLAEELQLKNKAYTQKLLLIAAGLYFGERLWVGQILQKILSWHEDNPSGKLLASCTYIYYMTKHP